MYLLQHVPPTLVPLNDEKSMMMISICQDWIISNLYAIILLLDVLKHLITFLPYL